MLGTPAFMSPEQILLQPTDARADLYGLGCAAVWLLSGQLPFKADNALAMLLAHVGEAEAAGVLDGAIDAALASGRLPNVSAHGPLGTRAATDAVLASLDGVAV
jgi:serine/threonine protein kinase